MALCVICKKPCFFLPACPDHVKEFFESENKSHANFLFKLYKEDWQKETKYLSSITAMSENKHYQDIISLGRLVVPLIMEDLKEHGPQHWFIALRKIVGPENSPVIPDEMAGKMQAITDLWLNWWEENKSTWDIK